MTIGSVQIVNIQGTDFAIIDDGNGGFTSMTKVDYDARPALISQQITPTV